MSLPEAYSLDLGKNINAKVADIEFQKGLIKNQKRFRCADVKCQIAVTCANLERPKKDRKVEPYFKSVEEHKTGCKYATKEAKSKKRTIADDYDEQVGVNDILLNLTEPTRKKENESTMDRETTDYTLIENIKNPQNKKGNIHRNQTRTLSVLVTAFKNRENYPIVLPLPFQESKNISDIFVEINGQELSQLEQNCWRIYWGKAWINKMPNGDYQIKFANKLKDNELEISPTFFVKKSMVETSTYKKFNIDAMDKRIKKLHIVYILSDVPATNHSRKYINFSLESLPYLEILEF